MKQKGRMTQESVFAELLAERTKTEVPSGIDDLSRLERLALSAKMADEVANFTEGVVVAHHNTTNHYREWERQEQERRNQ